MKEKYDGKNMSRLAPESSKETPKHPNLDKYLQKSNILDKIKDNYYDKGEANNEIYQEDNSRHTMQNSALVDGRELRGHVNNRKSISSKIAPRYSIENTKEEVDRPTRKFYKDEELLQIKRNYNIITKVYLLALIDNKNTEIRQHTDNISCDKHDKND